jgi:MEMO1 family protein
MNHYEAASINRRKDDLALAAVKDLDARTLHRVCLEEGISMCGFAPAVSAISAAVELGADTVDILDYSHSGMVTGDDSEVVSYAAVRIRRPGRPA